MERGKIDRTLLQMVGRTYLERGQPVRVLARWDGEGPRNVLVARADGTRVVRPFRGLRREPSQLERASSSISAE